MSNNASKQTNGNVRVISGDLPAHSPAAMEAAAALVALSQGPPNHDPSSTRGTLIWDVRTDTRQLENGRVKAFARAQNNDAFSPPAPWGLDAMLADRLWTISLVHLGPPQIELVSERCTAGAMPPTVLQVSSSSEKANVLKELLGRFVDLWDDHGYTRHTIGQMLARNNVLIPPSYISERLARRRASSDNDLRGFSDADLDAEMDDSGYEVDDEEEHNEGEDDDDDDDDDEDECEDWQSELEFWYDEH
ncbi:hypothetical protein GJ744_009447 [Endocarpon pusillum]|uniref:Uncharacterized protein n=1 Tax=Endocarpon pusillum TaxID=364733 RepID=A0A8H7E3S4_9EURO|nr:hypothetical protein GJ744_009447 [Endocarpon pusillum]